MICVEVDLDGYIVANGVPVAQCSEYILMLPSELDRMTYWADLAIALSPTEPALWALMAATLTLHASFYGLKAIRDHLRRPHS